MTKELAERAYIAGFNTALASFGKMRSVYLNAHCMVEFDKWYMRELNAMIPDAPKLPEVVVTLPDSVKHFQSIGRGLRMPRDAEEADHDAIEAIERKRFAAFDPDKFVAPNKAAHEDEQ